MKVNIREKLQVQWQASTLPNSKNLWPRMCQIPSKYRRSKKMTHHHSRNEIWPAADEYFLLAGDFNARTEVLNHGERSNPIFTTKSSTIFNVLAHAQALYGTLQIDCAHRYHANIHFHQSQAPYQPTYDS